MPYVAFTVDLDRDYPVPVQGSLKATSFSPENKPSFMCTIKGLGALVNLLEELGIKATFFIEARTIQHIKSKDETLIDFIVKNEIGCHGLDHEDLVGEYTGRPIPPSRRLALIKKATEIISETVKLKPVGFRAPYLRVPPNLGGILRSLGYIYDSSVCLETFKPPHPYLLGCRIFEVPLPLYPLESGKASLYTWALLEGKRKLDEFKKMLNTYLENDDGGLLVISTHAWHLAYRISSRSELSTKQVKGNIDMLREILTYVENIGGSLTLIEEYLKHNKKAEEASLSSLT